MALGFEGLVDTRIKLAAYLGRFLRIPGKDKEHPNTTPLERQQPSESMSTSILKGEMDLAKSSMLRFRVLTTVFAENPAVEKACRRSHPAEVKSS